MCWYHNDKCLEEPPEGVIGYIYLITNLLDNRIYVGKKVFLHKTKKRISKKVIKQTGTRKRIERGTKDSGWLKYWGSSKELLESIKEIGEENFKREILCFCKTKQELSYYELYWMIQKNVMYQPSYNNWIKATIYKSSLKQ